MALMTEASKVGVWICPTAFPCFLSVHFFDEKLFLLVGKKDGKNQENASQCGWESRRDTHI